MCADDLETAEKRLKGAEAASYAVARNFFSVRKLPSASPRLPACTRFDTVSVGKRKKAVG